MRRRPTHPSLPSLGLGLLLFMGACGDGASLDALFSRRRAASQEETQKPPKNGDDQKPEVAADEPLPTAWPQVTIINEEEFKYGIPDGDLVIKFQGVLPAGFELKCRAAPVVEINEAKKESCDDSYEVDDYEKGLDYRFEMFAVHEKSKSERQIASSDFRTDPIVVVVPEEPFIKTQYSGVAYLTLTTTTTLPAYFTCSTVSDLVWDPTLDCRDGTLRLEYTRYNGTVRLRILAWSLETNRLLTERDFFFCSGYQCARTIHPPVSPPPY